MKLESISRFLGHRSLESRQIYTHLAEGGTLRNDPVDHFSEEPACRVSKKYLQPYNNIPKYEITQLSEDEREF